MPAYSFLDVLAGITGPGIVLNLSGEGSGAAEEGISIEKNQKNNMVIGADGSVMQSLAADESGKLTVRLLKTSPIHLQLTAAYNLQKSSSSNWGQNTIVVTDVQRGDVYTCSQCAFAKAPNNVYARNGNVLEWEFDAGRVDILLGAGTPSLSQGI